MKINVKQLKRLIIEELEEMKVDAAPLPPHLDVASEEGLEEGEMCPCCEGEECDCDCTYCGSEDDDLSEMDAEDDMMELEPIGMESGHDHHEELEDSDAEHHSQEVHMVKSDLMKIADAARELSDMIDFNEELPAWVQSKVATAADRIDAIFHYMAYKHSK